MFGLTEELTLMQMVERIDEEVCIVLPDFLHDSVNNSFQLHRQGDKKSNRLLLDTPKGVIGREFENVIYVAPSYGYIENYASQDIPHFELLKVCSRAKGQLYIIDVGSKASVEVMLHDPQFSTGAKWNLLKSSLKYHHARSSMLPRWIDDGKILPLDISSKEAITYLIGKWISIL